MIPFQQGLGPIQDGGTVIVIGGGPGGSASAIYLKQQARASGRNIRVVIVEGKQFSGEHQYNQCAGVLSPPLEDLLENELNIPFPYHLTHRTISSYVLHTPHREIILNGTAKPSYAMRRVQFDAYMLEMAKNCGVEVLQARATDIELNSNEVIVYTENSPLIGDVIVGAFGMDEGTARFFQKAVGYQPPPSLSSIVTKYHPGKDRLEAFRNHIHAFLPSLPEIEFGAVTPKENHLVINIAGKAVDWHRMDIFLSLPEVRKLLPHLAKDSQDHPRDLNYYKGRFPCGLARRYTGDRYILIGDAAGLVRAFKGKGVSSAILTGIRAASVILHHGISAKAFQAYHAANQDILEDIPYSLAIRQLTITASRLGLMDAALIAAETNPILRQALFNAVSAYQPYKKVVGSAFSTTSLFSILKAYWFNRPHKN